MNPKTQNCFSLFFNMKRYKNVLLLLSLCSWTAHATVFIATVSQDSISLGDRILFNATALVPKGAVVTPPSPENSFGKFVVKEWNTGKSELKNADSLTFNFVLSLYVLEQCTIPAIPFVQTFNGKTDTLLSKPMPIRLVIIRDADSTNTSIKGLKPQQIVGSPSLAWLWIVLIVLGIIAAILLIRRYVKKRAKKGAEIVPLLPPYEEAMNSLRLLEAKQYLSKLMIREHVFELSDILKRYLERRFDVNAAEFTTEEMLAWIMRSPLEPDDKKSGEWFFSTTDPVKFAKWQPENDTLHRFGAEVRQIIERTRPKPETVSTPKEGANGV
jgi:hypothetical protein